MGLTTVQRSWDAWEGVPYIVPYCTCSRTVKWIQQRLALQCIVLPCFSFPSVRPVTSLGVGHPDVSRVSQSTHSVTSRWRLSTANSLPRRDVWLKWCHVLNC